MELNETSVSQIARHTNVRCKQNPSCMKLTEKQIAEIADNLNSGMRCFYNLKTGQIKTVLNLDKWIGAEEEFWEEEYKEIADNQADYFEFEGLESHDTFKIMTAFAEHVDDVKLRARLISALNKRKPFRNFKWEIDNSGPYRQQWFDYKMMQIIERVKEQIDFKNEDFSE